jgi:hypothetical protein
MSHDDSRLLGIPVHFLCSADFPLGKAHARAIMTQSQHKENVHLATPTGGSASSLPVNRNSVRLLSDEIGKKAHFPLSLLCASVSRCNLLSCLRVCEYVTSETVSYQQMTFEFRIEMPASMRMSQQKLNGKN